jgi:hypothetical protein
MHPNPRMERSGAAFFIFLYCISITDTLIQIVC